MRKIALILTTMVITLSSFAQYQPLRTTAWNYLRERQYEKAKETIDKVFTYEEAKSDPKSWHFSALIYHDIAIDTSASKIDPDPLTKSLESVKKSMELDVKKVYEDKNKRILIDLATLFFNSGVEYYNVGVTQSSKEGFTKALMRFDQYFESIKLLDKYAVYVYQTLMASGIDPKDIYLYAGICAEQLQEKTKAQDYYTYLVTQKYSKAAPYIGLSTILLENSDTSGAILALEQGEKNVTDLSNKSNIIIKEIIIYQKMGRPDVLITKLQNAINEEPNNYSFVINLGEAYYARFDTLSKLSNMAYKLKVNKAKDAEIKKEYGVPVSITKTMNNNIEGEQWVYSILTVNFENHVLKSFKNYPDPVIMKDTVNMNDYLAKAIENYDKSIKMISGLPNITAADSQYLFLINNKVGTIYFNVAVDYYNRSLDEKDMKKVEAISKEYNKNFDNAIPYLTKAMELDPKDKATIDLLKNIYIRKGDLVKVQELNKKLKE